MANGLGPISNLIGKVNSNNELVVDATVTVSGANGAILDGVDSNIKATVKDYTNSNPLAVVTVDTNGDYVSGSGGTQYNQGTASTDTDTATMAGVVRKDTPAIATGVADGDRTLLSVDSAGLAYVRLRQQLDADTGGGTANTDVVLMGLPGAGGPVAGGTSTNPLQVSLANTGANATAVTVGQGTASNLNATVVGTGTFVVQVNGDALTSLQLLDDAVSTTGAAVPAKGFQATGTDGTNARALKTDASGELQVDVLTLPATPAGTNLIGRVSSSLETSTIYNATTALTPKFATIAASSSGNNTLVSAVASNKIRVLAYNFISNGTVNAKFQSGASGTDLTGLKYCVANMGICAPFNPVGWFETGVNTLLNLNLSGAIAVGGELVYVEVP